jgi:hypothetical protein
LNGARVKQRINIKPKFSDKWKKKNCPQS